MPARATRYLPNPVIDGPPCTVAAINLDGHPTLRVTQSGLLVGYFASVETATAHGVDFGTAIVA